MLKKHKTVVSRWDETKVDDSGKSDEESQNLSTDEECAKSKAGRCHSRREVARANWGQACTQGGPT